ncbi:aromatic acid exporter family protein [Corynebacterium sp.]|uniref:FUSC family protein n=1 Tax=Corynebacterium sp. TaxID=1720 RepID=UPI0026DBB657|nr:FUSC family protein [Corynebacterium sp.]MDO5076806.1 FUSC family protein [Corynebacterium sp.]
MAPATSRVTHAAAARIAAGWARLHASRLYILQVGLAAGLSYWVALHVVGHPQPFFAPMATVIVLSTTGGERFRRSLELVAGVSLGVGLGDLMIHLVGSGVWQISVAVIVAIALGTFLDKGVLVANQAAFASILIATILPPGSTGGTDRMIDAFVGGVVGLIVMGLVPESPLRSGRREIAKILGITARVLDDVAAALRTNDTIVISAALASARGTQEGINAMIAAAKAGKESIDVSPLLWHQRRRVRSLIRILNPVDNAIRNTRVLARRALILAEDGDTVSDEQIEVIAELGAITRRLYELFSGTGSLTENTELPELVRRLRILGGKVGMDVATGRVLSAHVILAQSRSLIVDLLQICGLSRRSAAAVLKPTSETPAQPPEVWDNGRGA